MMNIENKFDDIDVMLFEFFHNDNEVPESTKKVIQNVSKKLKNEQHRFNVLKRIAIFIISIGIMTTSIVFAKDIVNFITSFFTHSTEAIDKAVENGYIQNVDMNFVYSSGIGIKVDYLMIDSMNMDISYIYTYEKENQIETIELYEYDIKNENDEIIYSLSQNGLTEYYETPRGMNKKGDISIVDENTLKESIIYSYPQISNIKKLIIDIKKVRIKLNNEYIIKDGNWIFDIDIEKKFIKNSEFYNVLENKYLNNSRVELTVTSLKIDLEFNLYIDEYVEKFGNIILKDNSGKEYTYNMGSIERKESITKISLVYDFSRYYDNIEKLDLILVISPEETINLKLIKE